MNGPFLELNFYQDESEQEFLIKLIALLVESGAKLNGSVEAHRGAGVKNTPYSWPSDEDTETISLHRLDDLRALSTDQNLRIVKVPLTMKSRRLAVSSPELVAVLPISVEAAAQGEHHPIAIWNCAEEIGLETAKAHTQAAKAYQKFIALTERLDPLYGAITVEYSLECLFDLLRDPSSYAFSDFYLSHRLSDASLISSITKLCSGCFIHQLTNGVYISTSGLFMPNPPQTMREQLKLSSEIAKLIASSTQFRTYR